MFINVYIGLEFRLTTKVIVSVLLKCT